MLHYDSDVDSYDKKLTMKTILNNLFLIILGNVEWGIGCMTKKDTKVL